MPKKRFSDDQMAVAPRQSEVGATAGEIRRMMEIAEVALQD
ncbi:hypothetical protein [Roseovarius nanhaiticus]|nr:hypothetical protein [Roseovarius nanhaiticus]